MAVVKVAASTGSATSRPPISDASSGDLPISIWRKIFSNTTTELSINREKASASPPSTIELMLAPIRFNTRNAASAESGIDSITATVARMLPRKIRIIAAVSTRPIPPSLPRLRIAVFTKTD